MKSRVIIALLVSFYSAHGCTPATNIDALCSITKDIMYGRYCPYLQYYFSITIVYDTFPIMIVPLTTTMNSFERIHFIVDYSFNNGHSIEAFSAVVKRHFGSLTVTTFVDAILLIMGAMIFITQLS